MAHHPHPGRRSILLGLAATVPLWHVAMPVAAAGASPDFLWASRIVTGSDTLTSGVAARIEGLLSAREAGFAGHLGQLVDAMKAAGGDRERMLSGLAPDEVAFALVIAKPWYLGYVGTPSSFVMDDDAGFATFLEAQSWEKIADVVPRITYPAHGPGWWGAVPDGVTAPAMPGGMAGWDARPAGPAAILPPDPAWRAFATADHATIEDARRARPGA